VDKNEQSNANSGERRAVSRRDFVANAALIGAGLAVAPLLACDRERPESSAPAKAAGGSSTEKRPLETRKLGALEVSALGHGCMSISANYGPPADRFGAAQVALTAAELGEIETASAALKVHGGRMNAEQMKVVDK
jgi:hypothetical protein